MTSVAVVVLDTMRADVFEDHFGWLPGTRFDHAWTTGNYTVPAHASLFGGRYPSELGVHAKAEWYDAPEPTLAERLRDAGHTTRAYSANPLISSLRDFDRGFEEFENGWHVEAADPDVFDWSGMTGASSLPTPLSYGEAALRCLVDRDSPTLRSLRAGYRMWSAPDDGAREFQRYVRRSDFGDDEFLFANLMEAHRPYWAPEGYETVSIPRESIESESETVKGGDVDFEDYWTAYNDCVRYLSDRYREVFDDLLSAFDYVVTLGDHGELFGEHGGSEHYYGAFEEVMHVPLVISGDGVADRRTSATASVLDVHRTVLERCGVAGDSRGLDLLTLVDQAGGAHGDTAESADGDSVGTGDGDAVETGDEDPPSPRAVLTEYLGFRPHRLDILEGRGFDASAIARYDVELCGVATEDSYYGCESVDEGFLERGEPRVDPQETLERLRDQRDVRAVDDQEAALAESTRSQLEQLGYV